MNNSLLLSLTLLLALNLTARMSVGQVLTTTNGTTLSVQAGATLYVAGSMQNDAGSMLTNTGTVQLTGDLTNSGTLLSTGTLLFTGTTNQTFLAGGATIKMLTLHNTGPIGSNYLLVPQDLTVTNSLLLTQGLVRTQGAAGATIHLLDGATVLGESPGRYVQGRLSVTRTTTNIGAIDFTNGVILNSNGQNLGAITITRTAGLQQAGLSYGTNMGGVANGIDRLWEVVAAQSPSAATPATITLSWVADDDNGFVPSTNAQLWRADAPAGPWVMQGATATPIGRFFTAEVSQLGILTISNTSQPLPVTLVTFTAQRQGTNGQLHWATALELHNSHFIVESSSDGTTFRALGQVTGHGTTSQANDYQFTDTNLARYAASRVYYRLRQVDQSGLETLSPVRVIQVPLTAGLLLQAYPNPYHQTVMLAIQTDQAGEATLSLTNALGQQIRQQRVVLPVGTTTLPLEAADNLPAGVYLIQLQQNQYQQTFRLIRQ